MTLNVFVGERRVRDGEERGGALRVVCGLCMVGYSVLVKGSNVEVCVLVKGKELEGCLGLVGKGVLVKGE